MDNFLLQIIVNELESLLIGHRLGKIYQIGATDLAIDFRLRDGRWLAVSTDPQRLALYLTARNPKQSGDELRSDTGFVALVKKYLDSARVITVEKLGYDRVVNFRFEIEDEDREIRMRTLVVSLAGRAANVLLTEESRIIGALRDRDDAVANYVEPAPPADKLDPFLCSKEKLDELIMASGGDLAKIAQKHLIGFSAVYARELAFRAKQSEPDDALRGLLNDLFESEPEPSIYSPVA
ncbi:MAG: NFACT family protein, partial [Acidobacteria bacterium]|nr:NFACT family protein [Acidobacteriota bacterium]